MKKIILSIVAVCALTTTFAQNSASLSQNGTSNSSNSAQAGRLQTVTVSQNGTGNTNTNQQFSHFTQQANITQTGLTNTANTYQNADAGPGNFITVTQNGTGAGGNTALVDQSDFFTINSQATVLQNGQNLKSTVVQHYAINDVAITDQTGASNNATITQGNGSQGSSNSYASIQQYSVFGPQDATISQLGDNNNAQIYQSNDAGPNNVATINQNGNNNIGFLDQSDFATVSTTGFISQLGNGNQAYLQQRGGGAFTSGSSATIGQTGNANYANLTQYGGANNQAAISQTGDLNVVTGVSGPAGLQIGVGNSLTVAQASLAGGPGQYAQVQQLGTGNVGTINQTGN
ncbi:hypothetical protein [Spirosoma radiotolerans]|uniref:Curlin associated repeat-containing protein n=1 Tax=Spirosoma radiotolerans TaxID=1379870 RepID=A0A0E3ZZD7_9BACT|nr:hypothetical protein [Spirosoma radiotolerans]AKD57290.1 hypothetical protein SD10_22750 [Spirosoma radiotolerans]